MPCLRGDFYVAARSYLRFQIGALHERFTDLFRGIASMKENQLRRGREGRKLDNELETAEALQMSCSKFSDKKRLRQLSSDGKVPGISIFIIILARHWPENFAPAANEASKRKRRNFAFFNINHCRIG